MTTPPDTNTINQIMAAERRRMVRRNDHDSGHPRVYGSVVNEPVRSRQQQGGDDA